MTPIKLFWLGVFTRYLVRPLPWFSKALQMISQSHLRLIGSCSISISTMAPPLRR